MVKVRPEPKPEEPVQFSVTIGPRKEYERAVPPEGYVNPMKVSFSMRVNISPLL